MTQENREWKPFSSAPLDGTHILLGGPYRMVVAWWGDIEPVDHWSDEPHKPRMCWMTDWDCKHGPAFLRLEYLNPTHWMPLPPPPSGCEEAP